MEQYRVTVHVRQKGAIGIFYPMECTVLTENAEEAKEKGLEVMQIQGFEVSHVTRVQQVENE